MYEGEHLREMGGVEKYLAAYTPELQRQLIDAATLARDTLAVSYREFLVGCAAVAVRVVDGREKLCIHSAGNYTRESNPSKPEEAKWCAERVVANLAVAEGGRFIPALVSVTRESDRGEGELNHGVLHPCPECRNLLRHLLQEGILHPKSKICNVNDADPDNIVIQERTVQELLDLYKDDKKAA